MKKKILRIISLALCLTVIMCILTACGSESTKVPEQIAVPEGGWTKRELMSVTTINNRRVSCPPILGEFKTKKLDMPKEYILFGENSNCATLVCDDSLFAIMYFKPNGSNELKDSDLVKSISMRHAIGSPCEQISLNGLKFGSSKDKMIECLGEPTYWMGRSETSAVYEFKDGGRMHIDIVLNQVFDIDIYGLC